MNFRLLVAFACSMLFTGGLFALMNVMISQTVDIETAESPVRIELTRLLQDSDIAERVRQKPKIDVPRPSPQKPTINIQAAAIADASANSLQISDALDLGTGDGAFAVSGGAVIGDASGASDRSAVPLVRIEPQYPPQAAERGLEGWVVVQFTISADGSVRDAVAIQSSNKIFEREAVRAVLRFKYQPQIEGGKAVELVQKITLRFNLDT